MTAAPAGPPTAWAPEVAEVLRDLFTWHLQGVTIQMVEPVPDGGVRLGVRCGAPATAQTMLSAHYGFPVVCYPFV
jgi:hypothetical protein